MIWDWLAREGWIVFNWWLLVTLAGVVVLPLCMRVFGGLPDKGYTFARAVGLLLVGFVFWLLASVGFINNSTGSIVLSWLLVGIIALVIYFRSETRVDVRGWWQENKRLVVTAEIVFAVLLLGWSIFRAYQNGLTGTEKPMELAFMSAVMRSETFPPNDPWLSGYAISYYYFGYVMSAMLAKLSGIASTIGFNMTIATWFALTGLTTFGVGYNLVRSRAFRRGGERSDDAPSQLAPIIVGLLATLCVVWLGNFQVLFIEIPYQTQSVPESYFQFWDIDARDQYYNSPYWNVEEGEQPPGLFEIRDPAFWDHWWWFRASRVLTDYTLDGAISGGAQPIDEFPQFSFLLSDNHPHVLALPFAILALGLALNVLLLWRDPTWLETVFYGLCLGGLIFLNTWDGPIYMVFVVGADALRRLMQKGRLEIGNWGQAIGVGLRALRRGQSQEILDETPELRVGDVGGLLKFGIGILVVALVAYLPFFIGFRSQASGILPNIINPTFFRHYFIMFGPFLVLLLPFLVVEAWRANKLARMNWRFGIQAVILLLVILLLFWVVLIFAGSLLPEAQGYINSFVAQNGGWDVALPAVARRRFDGILTTLVLLIALVFVIGRLFQPSRKRQNDAEPESESTPRLGYPPATGFAFLMIGAALMLSLIPEFIYLRDNFGTRINTVFKFYYQIWIMFSIASAYGVYTILKDHQLPRPHVSVKVGFAFSLALVLLVGSLFPAFGIHNRMFIETGRAANPAMTVTLDGGPDFVNFDDYQVAMCLNQHVQGDDAVVLEAVWTESAYKPFVGRVGTLTGIPIVLGWQNHEGQWRGPTYGETVGTRFQDVERVYRDLRWDVIVPILIQYDVDYIVYGQTERNLYGDAGEEKFIDNLEVVCQSGNSRIYAVGNSTNAVAGGFSG